MNFKLQSTGNLPFRNSMKFAIKTLTALAIVANLAAAIMGAVV